MFEQYNKKIIANVDEKSKELVENLLKKMQNTVKINEPIVKENK